MAGPRATAGGLNHSEFTTEAQRHREDRKKYKLFLLLVFSVSLCLCGEYSYTLTLYGQDGVERRRRPAAEHLGEPRPVQQRFVLAERALFSFRADQHVERLQQRPRRPGA